MHVLVAVVGVVALASAAQGECDNVGIVPDRLKTAVAACEKDLDSIIAHGTFRKVAERVPKRAVAYPRREEIIGCMLLCVFRKLDAVDSEDDAPTVEGLARYFARGATSRGYFLAATQSAHKCVSVGRSAPPEHLGPADDATRKCATMYAIFDCVRGQLSDFCRETRKLR